MNLEELRDDISIKQKKGLPFIYTSVVIWTLIAVIGFLDIDIYTKNILFLCSTSPMMLISWLIGKKIGVDIFSNENPLGKLGIIFTLNQILYLIIVCWVFNAYAEKMLMVYAIVFGAHLLPYSWLYKSRAYAVFSVFISVTALVVDIFLPSFVLGVFMMGVEVVFSVVLSLEVKKFVIEQLKS